MQTSGEHQSSGGISRLYHQPVRELEPYCLSEIQILDNNECPRNCIPQTYSGQYFTLESAPVTGYIVCDSSPSTGSNSSNRSSFSPQGSQSYQSDPHHSPDNTSGSPVSWSSGVDDGNELKHKLRELELSLLGPESDTIDSCNCSFRSGFYQASSVPRLVEMIPKLDLKQVLVACAKAVSEEDMPQVAGLMAILEQMVSVSGDPIQRLGAYMLEGLRARLESSGSCIYKALKCKEPTGPELLSYMHILYQICPYYKFAYMSSNVVIGEAIRNEPRIHIIDFQIAQGSQWIFLIQALASRPGGPPVIRITGVDDADSAYARGGPLEKVGLRLAKVAESCNVPFEFHAAGMSGCEVELENLRIFPGEAVAVNFPYMLHHMPDESVSTRNHRDRLLRLIKSLQPKVVSLVEQESNTNTSAFLPRFVETLDYYTAMFESIDVQRPRDDKERISAEQNCVARDVVNIIACEGAERVERHELLGKWRSRFAMAGFTPYPLSPSVTIAIKDMLKEYSQNFWLQERNGALYLGWKNRPLATSCAWV